MKALIIGATGATGKDLVQVLLQDPDYTQVVQFVRRPAGLSHPKLSEIVTGFEQPETLAEHIKGDVLFSCLGTTLKAAGSKEKQWHIDHDIPLQFAAVAKSNGVGTLVLLSAYGAAPDSRVFYSKMKGKLEAASAALAFDRYIIFRPGMLLRKNTDRLGERIIGGILNTLNSIGLLRKYKPLPTEILAEKMAKAPKVAASGTTIISLEKIATF